MKNAILTIFILFLVIEVKSQIGLTIDDGTVGEGYYLFHPNPSKHTYLIDNKGYIAYTWNGTHNPGTSVYLLEDGMLLRTGRVTSDFTVGGVGGYLEMVKPDGEIEWSYTFASESEQSHHDVEMLPNGNILLILFDKISGEDVLAAGRDPETFEGELWSEKIIEVKPIGTDEVEVVWEWRLWDHIVQDFDESKLNFGVIAENPHKVDVNFHIEAIEVRDWVHVNSIDYNAELDQIMIGSPFFSEIWIIDHSTTTAEAKTGAGGNSNKGGDLLYRWGNPQVYDQGTDEDRKFYGQHDPHWIQTDEGYSIIVFNNGQERSEPYSTVERMDLPYVAVDASYEISDNGAFLPESAELVYQAPDKLDFFSAIVSGVQILDGGGLLINEGINGRFFELNSSNEIIWEYRSPITNEGILCSKEVSSVSGNIVFRVMKFSPDYAGLPTNLTNEVLLSESNCPLNAENDFSISIYPTSFDDIVNVTSEKEIEKIVVTNLMGARVLEQDGQGDSQLVLNAENWSSGVYIVQVFESDGSYFMRKIVKKSSM
jgi:hypothetical protein